jgi:ATP-dependent Lon protease
MMPVLPLRDVVVFPHMVIPLFVGREKSIQALEQAMVNDKKIFLVAQKDAGQDDPNPDDIYRVGTIPKRRAILVPSLRCWIPWTRRKTSARSRF